MISTPKGAVFEDLFGILHYSFRQPALLTRAMTHPSAVAEREPRTERTYDRLEFLGDRVLALTIAKLLYDEFPEAPSGDLARRFNELVRRETLADVATSLGLGAHIIMADADAASGGANNPSILADVLEAVLAAIYLDGGLDSAQTFIHRHWHARAAALVRPPADAKTALQEWAQSLAKPPPTYRVVATEGPPHKPTFVVEVDVEGETSTQGRGPTKRQAEQLAAAALLEALTSLGDDPQ